MKKFLLIISFLYCLTSQVQAQTLPVGFHAYEEYWRNYQLLGQIDSTLSFIQRPISISAFPADMLPFLSEQKWSNKWLDIRLLPVSMRSSFNTNFPTSINDGAFRADGGLQKSLTGGVYLSKGNWSLQLMPELVFHENKNYDAFPEEHFDVIWERRYYYWNRIDQPERFGNQAELRMLLGQSALKYTFDNDISLGISTQNLWWGPAKRNALVMSNQAEGFLHFSAQTEKPILTKIGRFEGQFIAGQLGNSNQLPPDTARTNQGYQLYVPKRDQWRYVSGINLAYQPKWLEGLTLGYNKLTQLYADEIRGAADLIPFFNGSMSTGVAANTNRPRSQQMSSMYMRWLLQEAKAEFYLSYGTKGPSRSFREFIENPTLDRAFTGGVAKIYPVKNNSFVKVEMEASFLGQNTRGEIRSGDSWYVDNYIRQGFTHKGEVLGAGIGGGANAQFLGVTWFKGLDQVGLTIERRLHDNDFYYYAFEDSRDFRRFWVDLNIGLRGSKQLGQVLLSADILFTNAINYQWELYNDPAEYFVDGIDKQNLSFQVQATYFWK
ncbi:capsule assembly Wzi family protein [Penaeicola halotolerans]|uniref:capsule assembly Wzi family protein n=1 Tax=Penaeicola halotolerans TaxID=2793196 RepID=UPI001CF8583D|nr:capsule assembly Wzi family protein [Penaeicola halotolerans]